MKKLFLLILLCLMFSLSFAQRRVQTNPLSKEDSLRFARVQELKRKVKLKKENTTEFKAFLVGVAIAGAWWLNFVVKK